MGNPSFDPNSAGNHKFLMLVLKYTDIRALDVNAIAKEAGITIGSAQQRLRGIKKALEQAAEKGDGEEKTPSPNVSPKKRVASFTVGSTPRSRKRVRVIQVAEQENGEESSED
ncbi:hypothetical protein H072_4060 [Dactylellina haptotyla CBS 200.50]|uniref:Myb-like DNA-binding domain-containing protein n=1 Tax=Dactylellina haptotyla (strain CBS 200.50) TaxID=1284197 RepID=S8AGN2_DACHA|nr:hypothetical protein H072_4060 [Dactylellina haptotyla CBS 200.50]